ncbi:kinase-like protein [Aspergillus pseudoustus]|uniref:non-specific serine/threonine protein kinase n=1 Tax=Aspergillus pseudoustus TaxID=1810923 RepID=A0ABR4KGX4_9EURO
MTTLLRRTRNAARRPPFAALKFSNSNRKRISTFKHLKEARFESSRYRAVGKLGFGVTSTVWLARDLDGGCQYVTLKVYTRDEDNQEEFQIYKQLSKGSSSHPCHAHVRSRLETFTIFRRGGDHHCLVQKPMWESFSDLQYRNPAQRFTGLMQVFLALDYLHTECKLVHTDIKGENILPEIEDTAVLESFTKAELENPPPRISIHGAPVYTSRQFDLPEIFCRAALSDFGSAVQGDEQRNYNAQPNVYPVDIWNVGVMIWDLFEGKPMFYGNDPDGEGYSTRAHLAEVIGILGPPALDLISRGTKSRKFFTEDGKWKQDIQVPKDTSLEEAEEFLEGRHKAMFLKFMRGMPLWWPEDRKTARELLEDPWLNEEF